MKTLFPTLILVILFSFAGCNKDKPVIKDKPAAGTCGEIEKIVTNNTTTYYHDAFSIERQWVEGDELKLTVNYGGGGNGHEFRLIWNNLSAQPQNAVMLSHNANGGGRQPVLIEKDICFNLSLLKGNQAHGEFDFPLTDTDGKTVDVRYIY